MAHVNPLTRRLHFSINSFFSTWWWHSLESVNFKHPSMKAKDFELLAMLATSLNKIFLHRYGPFFEWWQLLRQDFLLRRITRLESSHTCWLCCFLYKWLSKFQHEAKVRQQNDTNKSAPFCSVWKVTNAFFERVSLDEVLCLQQISK